MPKVPGQHKRDGYYLGIDPGIHGGLAVVKETEAVETWTMPGTVLDLVTLVKYISKEYPISFCYLERVQSMPNEGHKGAFTFGKGFGRLEMALAYGTIPHEIIIPRSWQKELSIVAKAKNETRPAFKERLRIKAQQLFPAFPMWALPRTVTKQREICDAMLLAEACRRSRQ